MSREVIENSFKKTEEKIPEHLLWPIITPSITQAKGTFVTLGAKDGTLRGCLGQIASQKPLYQTVVDMSKSAALKDTRFTPIKKEELDNIIIDITVLSPPRQVSTFHEIVIGQHGIILNKFEKDGSLKASSVFLPQVPPSFGWDLRTTLEQLSMKAKLGKDGWKDSCEFQVFEGFEIKEHKKD